MDGHAGKGSNAMVREGYPGPDECQSGKLLLDLGNLPGDSSNEDRLQMCEEVIRTRKYLGEKLLPLH